MSHYCLSNLYRLLPTLKVHVLITHTNNMDTLCLGDMWFALNLRTDTKKDTCLKDIGLHAQKMLTILGSKVNMIGKTSTTT